MCGMGSPDQYCDNSMHHLCPIELQVIATRIFNNPRRTAGYLWWSFIILMYSAWLVQPTLFQCESLQNAVQFCVNTLHFYSVMTCGIWWTCSTQFLHLYFTFDPEKIKVLEEMGFFRQKLFNLEQMILSEERGPAVSGYGWVFVVNVTVVPLSKAVGVELYASSVLFGTHL